MNFFHILVRSFLLLCFVSPLSFATTLVQDDIVQDTIWTAEMSPVIVERSKDDRDAGQYNIHVVNGATLTVEAGVIVVMGNETSLRVAQHCQRDYFGKCMRGDDNKTTYPKLIVNGTTKEPVLFTSTSEYKKSNGVAGEWGVLDLQTKGNILHNVSFENGGFGEHSFALYFGQNPDLQNIVVQDILGSVGMYDGTVNNSVFQNLTEGVSCENTCTITNSVFQNLEFDALTVFSRDDVVVENNSFLDNKKNGFVLSSHKNVSLKNNFFYNNKDSAVNILSEYNEPLIIQNNNFVNNGGALSVYRPFESIQIENNNFLDNSQFAIQSRAQTEKELITTHNWFGIDSGATKEEGTYYVVDGVNVSNFATEANDFALSKGTVADFIYKDFLKNRKMDTRVFAFTVDRGIFLGNGNNAGSLLQYKVEAKNEKTKMLHDVKVNIQIPSDQILLICSVKIDQESIYNLRDVCTNAVNNKTKTTTKKIIWEDNFAALTQQNLFFVTVLQNSVSNVDSVELPKISFTESSVSTDVNYSLGFNAEVHTEEVLMSETLNSAEDISSPVVTNTSTVAPVTTKAVTSSTINTSIHPKILAKRFQTTPNLSSNANWNAYPLALRKQAYAIIEEWNAERATAKVEGALEQGKVVQRVLNDQLYFYLKTESGAEFKLLSSSMWSELLAVSRNKENNTAVFGKYYVNRNGEKTGILFTKLQSL